MHPHRRGLRSRQRLDTSGAAGRKHAWVWGVGTFGEVISVGAVAEVDTVY